MDSQQSVRCPKCKNGGGKYRRTRPWPPRTITCPLCNGSGVVPKTGKEKPVPRLRCVDCGTLVDDGTYGPPRCPGCIKGHYGTDMRASSRKE